MILSTHDVAGFVREVELAHGALVSAKLGRLSRSDAVDAVDRLSRALREFKRTADQAPREQAPGDNGGGR